MDEFDEDVKRIVSDLEGLERCVYAKGKSGEVYLIPGCDSSMGPEPWQCSSDTLSVRLESAGMTISKLRSELKKRDYQEKKLSDMRRRLKVTMAILVAACRRAGIDKPETLVGMRVSRHTLEDIAVWKKRLLAFNPHPRQPPSW